MGDYKTCANARPIASKWGGENRYSCPYCSTKTGVIDDLKVCQECCSYADRKLEIWIAADSFRAVLYMNRLSDLTITGARKLFRLIQRYNRENEDAIARLGSYLKMKSNTKALGESPKERKKWSRLLDIWTETCCKKSRK